MSEFETALKKTFEEGERGDWDAYALRRPTTVRTLDIRPQLARLLAEADLPSLRFRTALLRINAELTSAATRVDAIEDEGGDPASLLIELFARKELLAREAGHAGYAQLALVADGVTTEEVIAELAEAEQMARHEATREPGTDVERLVNERDVRDRFRSFFAPLLDGVEVRLDQDALVAGMCKALRWPDRFAVVVRPADAAASATRRVAALGTLAHELGHALQWRARAQRGLGFLDFFSLPALEAETAADIGERLLFESSVGNELALPTALWSRQRALTMLDLIGRARFEIAAYAAALDAPATLPTLWRDLCGAHAPRSEKWSRSGHGFYTEDPMRRYTYPLAYARSERRLSTLAQPLSKEQVMRLL